MRPVTAKQRQSDRIWIENDPDPSENRRSRGFVRIRELQHR